MKLLRLACLALGHNVDAITGACHMCGQQILNPINVRRERARLMSDAGRGRITLAEFARRYDAMRGTAHLLPIATPLSDGLRAARAAQRESADAVKEREFADAVKEAGDIDAGNAVTCTSSSDGDRHEVDFAGYLVLTPGDLRNMAAAMAYSADARREKRIERRDDFDSNFS